METKIVSTKIEKLQTVKVDGVYVNLENTHLVLIDGKYQHVECIGDGCHLCKYVDKINSFNYTIIKINGSKIEKTLVKDVNQLVFVNTVDKNHQFKRIRYKKPFNSQFTDFDYFKVELPKLNNCANFDWVFVTEFIPALNREVAFTYIKDVYLGGDVSDFTPIPFNKYQYMKSQSEINFDKINEVINMIDDLIASIEIKRIAISEINQK